MRPMLVKSLPVYFSVDTVVTSQAVLEAFDNAGIDVDFITSIQWPASNRTWVVDFENQLAKETALEIASLEIAGKTVFLGDCENRLVSLGPGQNLQSTNGIATHGRYRPFKSFLLCDELSE